MVKGPLQELSAVAERLDVCTDNKNFGSSRKLLERNPRTIVTVLPVTIIWTKDEGPDAFFVR